jgi:NTP pyrophosphatase (non-canonical NTP hydrolase)
VSAIDEANGKRALAVTLDEYQAAAVRTMNPGLSESARLVDAAAGLAEEAGEVLGLVRKHVYMNHALDRERITAELGDVLWCVAALTTLLGTTLDRVAAMNVEKLRRRYPAGYSDTASAQREEEHSTDRGD